MCSANCAKPTVVRDTLGTALKLVPKMESGVTFTHRLDPNRRSVSIVPNAALSAARAIAKIPFVLHASMGLSANAKSTI